jgi:hypothetical protein
MRCKVLNEGDFAVGEPRAFDAVRQSVAKRGVERVAVGL